jgi:hypothetical protein
MLGCFVSLTYLFSISSVDLPLYGDFSGVNWAAPRLETAALSGDPAWSPRHLR